MARRSTRVWQGLLMMLVALGAGFGCSAASTDEQGTVTTGKVTGPPPTKVTVVTDTLHGVTIEDPYRWLEDVEDPEVLSWIDAQNAYADSVLGAYPGKEAIHDAMASLMTIEQIGTPSFEHGVYVYERRSGDQDQPSLYVRKGAEGPEELLFDVDALSDDGTTSVDWAYLSPKGTYLAFGTSEGGSELSTLHVVGTADKELLADAIPHTRSASLGWLPDESGFYYTRYPTPGSVPAGDEKYYRSIYLHHLGDDPAKDALVYAPDEAHKTRWNDLHLSSDGRWLTLLSNEGWAKTEVYLADTTKSPLTFVPVVEGIEAVFQAGVIDGTLYALTNHDAPTYRLMTADPEAPTMTSWKELVPPRPDAVLEDFEVTPGGLVLLYTEKASSHLYMAALDGTGLQEIPLPGLGTVPYLSSDEAGAEVMFAYSSFATATQIHTLDTATKTTSLWHAVQTPGLDTSKVVTEQVVYQSKDGTEVTMFLSHLQGLPLDGDNPTVMYGYGGFNVSITPRFSPSALYWISKGGVYAVPNLRGGGEYGEQWHKAGMGDKKQNVFDDFIAAAEWLFASKYTSKDKLGVMGGSNGGLLTGAFVTQRPDLAKAALVAVPLLDMLRYHLFLIAKLWVPEYGSADDPDQLAYLKAYSPYHNVVKGTSYPAVFLTTAMSDSRVHPCHALKMTARLQAATASDQPIILKVETKAGHGKGKPVSKKVEELTERWTFFAMTLGLDL